MCHGLMSRGSVDVSEEPGSHLEEGGFLRSTVAHLTLAVVAVVVVLVVAAMIAVYLYRSSRNKPLEVAIYPGATLVNSETVYRGFDHQQYTSSDPFDKIEQFYAARKDITCEPQYSVVEQVPGQTAPRKEGHIFTRCQIDHSGWGMTQYTTIVIQPVYDENQNLTGQVTIDVQRHWGG
jgi:hypothetical protein